MDTYRFGKNRQPIFKQPVFKQEEKIYLYVPFGYKDEAKSKGAKYDAENKRWYIHKSNPQYDYMVELYNHKNFADSAFGVVIIGTKLDDIENKYFNKKIN
jgi:hypothetical protein